MGHNLEGLARLIQLQQGVYEQIVARAGVGGDFGALAMFDYRDDNNNHHAYFPPSAEAYATALGAQPVDDLPERNLMNFGLLIAGDAGRAWQQVQEAEDD